MRFQVEDVFIFHRALSPAAEAQEGSSSGLRALILLEAPPREVFGRVQGPA